MVDGGRLGEGFRTWHSDPRSQGDVRGLLADAGAFQGLFSRSRCLRTPQVRWWHHRSVASGSSTSAQGAEVISGHLRAFWPVGGPIPPSGGRSSLSVALMTWIGPWVGCVGGVFVGGAGDLAELLVCGHFVRFLAECSAGGTFPQCWGKVGPRALARALADKRRQLQGQFPPLIRRQVPPAALLASRSTHSGGHIWSSTTLQGVPMSLVTCAPMPSASLLALFMRQ